MAYALVGSAGTVASGTGSVSPAFGQATTAGNLLIAWVYGRASAIPTTSATGWVQATSDSSNAMRMQIWYRPNCGAGEAAPTFTQTASVMFAALAEFSGGDTGSPLDKAGTNQESAGGASLTATASGADAASGELVVSVGGWALSKAGTDTTTFSFNNGASPTTNLNNDATSTTDHYRMAWGTTTGNSAADANATTNSSMNAALSAVVIASFKLASVATRATFANPTNFMDPGLF